MTGWIQTLKSGYGFIVPDQGGQNMFFFHEDLNGNDFLELKVGDRVQFVVGQNDRGPCTRKCTTPRQRELELADKPPEREASAPRERLLGADAPRWGFVR